MHTNHTPESEVEERSSLSIDEFPADNAAEHTSFDEFVEQHFKPAIKEFEIFTNLTKETAAYSGNCLKIFGYELQLALKALLKLYLVQKTVLPIALLLWLGISSGFAVMSYDLHQTVYWSIFIFAGIQALLLAGIIFHIWHQRRYLRFSETGNQLNEAYKMYQKLKSPGLVK